MDEELIFSVVTCEASWLVCRGPLTPAPPPCSAAQTYMSIVRQERILWATLGLATGAASYLDIRVSTQINKWRCLANIFSRAADFTAQVAPVTRRS